MNKIRISKQDFKKMAKPFLYTKFPKYITSKAYTVQFGGSWYKAHDKIMNDPVVPKFHGDLSVDLLKEVRHEIPETGVLKLDNALVFGGTGRIFSSEGYLLIDHSWYRGFPSEMEEIPGFLWRGLARTLPVTKRLRGTCLSLHTDFAVGSYPHFLLEAISRLEIFYKAGFRLSDVDYIYCPQPPSKNAQKLFDQLELPRDKCVFAQRNIDTVIVDTLLAPTYPGVRKNYPQWIPEFIQRQVLPSFPTPRRRLYISRSGYSRNIVNEKAILNILGKYDFEIYDPRHHENQPYDFAEAEIVIGPHGGGLTNLIFCQPGTPVLELMPDNFVHPYFYSLAYAARLRYHCMICPAIQNYPFNIHVNEPIFENALASIIGKLK